MSELQVEAREREESEEEAELLTEERFPEEREAVDALDEAIETADKFLLYLEAAREAGIDTDNDLGLARWDMARTLLDVGQEDTIPDLFDAVEESETAAKEASERLAEEDGYKEDAETVMDNLEDWDNAPWTPD